MLHHTVSLGQHVSCLIKRYTVQGTQLSWNFTDVLKLEIVLKFYSFGQNVLKLTFVTLS